MTMPQQSSNAARLAIGCSQWASKLHQVTGVLHFVRCSSTSRTNLLRGGSAAIPHAASWNNSSPSILHLQPLQCLEQLLVAASWLVEHRPQQAAPASAETTRCQPWRRREPAGCLPRSGCRPQRRSPKSPSSWVALAAFQVRRHCLARPWGRLPPSRAVTLPAASCIR
jgi:hypothetical protein